MTCPACTAPGLQLSRDGKCTCLYCGSTFQRDIAICPVCGQINDINATTCSSCGESLDLADRVLTRQPSAGSLQWMEGRRERISELRDREAQAAEQRMELLEEIDRKRMQMEAETALQQQRRDRSLSLLLLITMSLLSLICLAAIALTLWKVLST